MLGAMVPHVLCQQWFWLLISVALLVPLYIAKKKYPPPFPKTGAFLSRHQKSIVRAADLFIIASVVFFGGFCLSLAIRRTVDALLAAESIRAIALRSAWLGGLVAMIFWSSMAALLIGLLSSFHSNFTKRKRIFLLLVCLLPAALAVLALATVPADFRWSMIQLGAIACVPGWIVNAPPILVGQHVTDFVRRIMCKLRLISSDSSS